MSVQPSRSGVVEDRGGALPDFLIIGAMKCGTTSLYHYLRDHPQIFMPSIKAPEFFAEESNWGRGIGWYRRQFEGAGPGVVAIGEASNVYTKYPRYRGVPARIADHIPHARLVYVVRDPIDRIRSHYQTRVTEGTERSPIGLAVRENPIYLDYSRYAMQLDQYLDHFPREQLLVITAEDLRDDRQATVQEVYGFLGVGSDHVPDDMDRVFYETKHRAPRSPVPLWLRKGLKRHLPAAKRAKELENNVVRALRALRRKPEGASELAPHLVIPDDVRAELADSLMDDVRRLRTSLAPGLGPGLDGWGIA
ncbi:MAG: sulfotransferase family protein [Actinomycetota bacterium]